MQRRLTAIALAVAVLALSLAAAGTGTFRKYGIDREEVQTLKQLLVALTEKNDDSALVEEVLPRFQGYRFSYTQRVQRIQASFLELERKTQRELLL